MKQLTAKLSGIKSMLYYAIGLFMMKGLSLIMLPFITANLSVDEVGKLEFLATIAAFLGLFICLAMHEALYRFSGVEKSHSNKKRIAAQIYTLTLTIAVVTLPVLLISCYLFLAKLTTLISHQEFSILAFGLSVEGALGVSLAWLRMQDKARSFFLITVSTSIIQIMLVFIAIKFNAGVSGILLSSVVSHALQLAVLHKLHRWSLALPDKASLNLFLTYCFPLAMAGLTGFALNGAEKWILTYSTSLTDLALYAIALKFSLAMCILVQPFGLWWMPKRFHHLEKFGNTATVTVSQYGIIWILMLAVSIAFAAPIFIDLALPDNYLISGKFVLGALSIAVMKELCEIINIGLLYKRKTGDLLAINITTSVIGIAAAWQLNAFGVWGILAAINVAYLVKLALTITLSQKQHHLPYQYFSIALLLLITLLFLVISYSLSDRVTQSMLVIAAPITILFTAWGAGLIPNIPLSINGLKRL